MAGDDAERLTWLRSCPCAKCKRAAPSEAHHHTGRRALSRRASDEDAMPLCLQCHRDFHGATGAFKGWTKRQRRAWQDATVELYRALYERKEGVF